MRENPLFNDVEWLYQPDYLAEVKRRIESKYKEYLLENGLKSVVMGISGGVDSGLNAVITRNVCRDCDIKFYGKYIPIESNKPEEEERANMIGKCFCSEYNIHDLTDLYRITVACLEADDGELESDEHATKVRRGNIKARMRMTRLYDLASLREGLVVDNDNMTEHQLGFWTLHGDVGDITPLADLLKTEVYELANYYLTTLENDEERAALQAVIDAVPTDGLGITSSDVEQFGVDNYDIVDRILIQILNTDSDIEISEAGEKIYKRHKASAYKRNHPYKIRLLD